jgi:translation initiation factor IF-3
MFRGREMAHPELGLRILERIAEEVSNIAIVESAPRQDGRNMTMVLHPAKGGRRPKPAKDDGAPKSAPAPTEGGGSGASEPAKAVTTAADETGAT